MLKGRVKLFLPNTNIWDLDGASECVWNGFSLVSPSLILTGVCCWFFLSRRVFWFFGEQPASIARELSPPAPLTVANQFHFCWSLTSVVMPLEPRSSLPAFICWCYFYSRRVFLDKIWWLLLLTFIPCCLLLPQDPHEDYWKHLFILWPQLGLKYNMIPKQISFNWSALNYSSLTF